MIDLAHYSEPKPHRLRLILWRVLNATLFPLLPANGRRLLLRAFGAYVGKSLFYRSVRIYAPWNLRVGNLSCIGPGVELYCKAPIAIGDNTVISQGAYLCTATHDLTSPVMALKTAPIVIGNDCWVAARVAILPGVTFGDGAVAGLGAVVTRTVPSLTVVAGNPARPIKTRTIQKES